MSQVLGDEVPEEYALEESSKGSISIFVNISSNADSYLLFDVLNDSIR